MTLTTQACSIEGCEHAVKARGWCRKHYLRWWQTGSLADRLVTIDRFWASVDATGECWLWTGTRSRKGYGQFSIGPRANCTQVRAHRFAWEMANERPAPPDLVVRHRCDTPACVNPEHLESGTIADNNRDRLERGGYSRRVAA